jgi:hypothetical protein
MEISELNESDRLKALEYQRNEKDLAYDKKTDILINAFNWSETNEGHCYWNKLHELPSKEITKDENVQNVINQLKSRSEVGFKKYGVTTERKDIDLLGWLQHLQEELMDATIYIERLKQEIK